MNSISPGRATPRDPDSWADLVSLRALIISEIRELRGGRPILPVACGWIEVRGKAMATGLGDWDALIHHGPGGGRPIGAAEALALMLDRLSRQHGAQGRALARRVRASRQRIAVIAAARMDRPDGPPDHLTAEQAMIAGHWMHPCPKALSGMTLPEERAMTPDWRGALRLRLLSVASDLIEATAPDLARDLPGMDIDPGPGRGLLPVHPLAWDRARHDPRIAALIAAGGVTDLGPMGPGWWATSSVRTLWRPDSPWQLKTSLPVTITNSQRVNRRHEMLAGAAMAGRAGALSGRFGPLRLVADPHWMTLRLPGGAAAGLEVILRDNPWRGGRGGAVMQLGGLVAPPLPGRASLLAQVMTGPPEAWFRAYLDCAVAPLLRIYDATGIAVEAHQQNALLDLEGGLPRRCDIRDNQGFYVAEDMAPPEWRAIPQLVYPRAEAEAALGYALIVNQVFGVIHRMDLDGIWPEDAALTVLAEHLRGLAALPGHGGALARSWRERPTLPAKGNMLTQLGGVDELLIPGERAPMIRIANPLPARAAAGALADVA